MATLRCTVAIPTRELFSGEIAYASIPGADGSYGVLPGHELFVGTNSKGILSLWLDADGKDRREFLIMEGAAQVFNDIVTVLGRFGAEVSEIDADVVAKKAEDMRAKIAELEKADDEQSKAALETSRTRLEWYELQLSVADGSTK